MMISIIFIQSAVLIQITNQEGFFDIDGNFAACPTGSLDCLFALPVSHGCASMPVNVGADRAYFTVCGNFSRLVVARVFSAQAPAAGGHFFLDWSTASSCRWLVGAWVLACQAMSGSIESRPGRAPHIGLPGSFRRSTGKDGRDRNSLDWPRKKFFKKL
jgi:hypothetical protein